MALYELLHANEYNNKESHSEALKNWKCQQIW
jgi:hypothetical protein